MFNMVGIEVKSENAPDPAPILDEANTPGLLLIGIQSATANAVIGTVWVEYCVDLYSPNMPTGGAGLSLYSSSTDSSDLALQTGAASGMLALFPRQNNSIKFMRPGSYSVYIVYSGTNPVPDDDGHILYNEFGDAKPSFSYGANTQAGVMSFNGDSLVSSGLSVVSSAEAANFFVVHVDSGDVLELDALTSGTLASTRIIITPMPTGMPITLT